MTPCKNYAVTWITGVPGCHNCRNRSTDNVGAVPGNWCRNYSEKPKKSVKNLEKPPKKLKNRLQIRKIIPKNK